MTKQFDISRVPRYPPVEIGISASPTHALLEYNQDIVDALRRCVANQELFDAHYYPVMFRMANMVHLLPASQSHHHRRNGGLLRHSLEVGLYAIQLAEEKFPLAACRT